MPIICLNVYSQLLKKHVFTASESSRRTGSSCPCTVVRSCFCWCRFLRQSETRWRKLWPRRNYFYTLCASGLGNSHVMASWLSCSTSEVFPHHNKLIVDRCNTGRAEIWKHQIKMELCGSVSEVGMLASVRICSTLECDWSVFIRRCCVSEVLCFLASIDSRGLGLLLLDAPKENKLAKVILKERICTVLCLLTHFITHSRKKSATYWYLMQRLS